MNMELMIIGMLQFIELDYWWKLKKKIIFNFLKINYKYYVRLKIKNFM